MICPYDIIGYVQERFQDLSYANSEQEIRINSIFTDDTKKKLYINVETGLWICFKTGNKGNFVTFVAENEQIPYKKAELFLAEKYVGTTLLFKHKIESEETTDLTHFYDHVCKIPYEVEYDDDDIVKNCWAYLFRRNLLDHTNRHIFYAGISGPFEGRVIIPFFAGDNERKLLYYQARALDPAVKPRYLNCKTTKKSAILYPYNTLDNYVVICEGPIDAISLQQQGINATAIMGSSISEPQLRALKMFNGSLIAGFDNDEAGRKSLLTMERMRKKMNMPPVEYVFPPNPFKDWNEAHCKNFDLRSYVLTTRKRLTELDVISMSISEL